MADKYDAVKNLKCDPKMVAQIQASPQMLSEQGGSANFMARFGGASGYIEAAKMPLTQRVTFFAINDGLSDEAEIAASTGLTRAEVKSAVAGLKSKGLVKESQVSADLESEGVLL